MGKCINCGESLPIPIKRTHRRGSFCNNRCKSVYYNPKRPDDLGRLSTSHLGTWGELLVCANLIRKGWYVFRSVSPSGPFDLIGVRLHVTLRFEVTVGKITPLGITYHPHSLAKIQPDVFAVVLDDSTIIYIPPLPED